MNELDYKFVMGHLYNENISCKEISDSVNKVVAHTVINGEKYALDQAGVNSYNRYKDSLAAQVYYLSIASKTPYAMLYAEVVMPLERGERVNSIFLEDIFIRSLFDSDIHSAVSNCLDYDKRIFANVEPLVLPSGKELRVGDIMTTSKTTEIINYNNDYYIHLHYPESDMHKIQEFKVNVLYRNVVSNVVCESKTEEELYTELVAHIMHDKIKHPSNQLSTLAKRLIDNLGLENKTKAEIVVKAYYKEANKQNVSSIGTFIG